jgi:hypothetical protein
LSFSDAEKGPFGPARNYGVPGAVKDRAEGRLAMASGDKNAVMAGSAQRDTS